MSISSTFFRPLAMGLLAWAAFSPVQAQNGEATTEELRQRNSLTINTNAAPGTRQDDGDGPTLTLGGYVDGYFMYSTDSSTINGFEKYTTIGLRNREWGLNVAEIHANYSSKKVRSNLSLFFGDINNNWDVTFPFIQQANVGYQLLDGLWWDVGIFNTHIGTELLLPKDNLLSSLALGTQFEPFYMAGASLSWEKSEKFSAKLIICNSYSTLGQENDNFAGGLFLGFNPSDKISIGISNLTSNEAANKEVDPMQVRIYNNVWFAYTTEKFNLLVGGDVAMQTNSAYELDTTTLEVDTTTGMAFSGILSAKYHVSDKFAIALRGEYFNNGDGILATGPVARDDVNDPVAPGLQAIGGTLGLEVTPIPNAYARIEGRYITALDDQLPFTDADGEGTAGRFQLLVNVGVHFDSGNLIK